MKAFDKDGKDLDAPVWEILGHELIHARHNQAGRNLRQLHPTTDASFGNREEEQTIDTGDLTENMLREEHGLKGKRFGHGARDTRSP
jgi:hypothetical protein